MDVARVAGVSTAAVSFALNGRPGVAADTRDRILGVAADLGWEPNASARSLGGRREHALGLVIARDPLLLSADPFFPAFIAGVELELSARGQALLLQVVGDDAEQEADALPPPRALGARRRRLPHRPALRRPADRAAAGARAAGGHAQPPRRPEPVPGGLPGRRPGRRGRRPPPRRARPHADRLRRGPRGPAPRRAPARGLGRGDARRSASAPTSSRSPTSPPPRARRPRARCSRPTIARRRSSTPTTSMAIAGLDRRARAGLRPAARPVPRWATRTQSSRPTSTHRSHPSAPTPSQWGRTATRVLLDAIDGRPADVELEPARLRGAGLDQRGDPHEHPPGPGHRRRCAALAAGCGGGGGASGVRRRRRPRPDQGLVLEQRRRRWRGARRWSARWNTGASEREGHGPGDPDRQELRGGHRRRDHRRQRAVPGPEHLAGRRARASRSRAGWSRSTTCRAAREYIESRTRRGGGAVPVAGRQVLPAAVEGQPGDDLLQQEALQEGRDRRREPAAGARTTSSSRPRASSSRAAPRRPPSTRRRRASSTSRGSTSTRCSSPSRASSSSRTARRSSTRPRASRSPSFWETMYSERLAPKEKYNGDSFADGKAAMAIVGPWAIAVYGDKVDWGVAPGADLRGQARERGPDVLRREVDRDVQRLQEPRHGVGRPEVRDLRGAGRRVPGGVRPDADAHRPAGHLPGVLRQARRVQDVRRPGLAHRRGARTSPTR